MKRGVRPQRRPHREFPPGVCPVYDRCNGEAERAGNGTVQPPQPNELPFSRSALRLLRGLGFLAGGLAVLTLGPFYFVRRAGRRMRRVLFRRRGEL